MTYSELRAGKKLSGKHTKSVQHAVGLLKGLLKSAGEEDDVEPIMPYVGGDTGDLGGQATATTVGQDGTGVARIAGQPAGPTARMGGSGQRMEVR